MFQLKILQFKRPNALNENIPIKLKTIKQLNVHITTVYQTALKAYGLDTTSYEHLLLQFMMSHKVNNFSLYSTDIVKIISNSCACFRINSHVT